MAEEFTGRAVSIISSIPRGKVLTYGGIAALAGDPKGARQVSRILHSMSRKYNLPWHRVINSQGRISLPHPADYEEQRRLLEDEGVQFSLADRIDLDTYMWDPGDEDFRMPSILIPYGGPCFEHPCHDVFVYLRPETNGVQVESTLFRVVKGDKTYRETVKLVYLANIPGSFIRRNRILEHYYRCQLYFVSGGKAAFTPFMRNAFEAYFNVSFEEAPLVNPFEALKLLSMNYDELFQVRVPLSDMLLINGQTVKRYRGCYILNYDIPAILHKNNNTTDIAAMMFRVHMDYAAVHNLIDDMGRALIAADILHPEKPLSRIFHYSKGPFDQIRDAQGYLYTRDNRHVTLDSLSFCAFLLEQGITMEEITDTITNPVVRMSPDGGRQGERYLFEATADDSFQDAARKFSRIHSLLRCD